MSRTYGVPVRAVRPASPVRAAATSLAALAIAATLTAATEGCSRSAAAENAPATPALTLVAEDLARVERRTLASGPIIAGTLTARRRATVRAEIGGSVTAVYADRGTIVAAGAPLLRIEGRAMLDAQVAAASDLRTDEGALAIARRRLTRSESLVAGGAIALDEVEDARQTVTSAESRVAASRARLSAASDGLARTLVRAPFAGIVSARPVNGGDIVESGDVLFEVLDPRTMYVEGSVPSAQVGAVHVGAKVDLTVSGFPGRTFSGRIERLSPAADPATRQVPVFVAVANGDGGLLAGLFAEGRIASATGSVLVVPAASIEQRGGSDSVVRLAGGRIERRSVETGGRDPDGAVVEIRSGLALGDTVLLGVAPTLPSGTAARIAGAKPGPAVTPNER